MRYLKMLQRVPRHPRGITAAELHRQLQSDGFEINRRSIERDLDHLSEPMQLTKTETRPALWSWTEKSPFATLPAPDPASALTCELVARFLQPLLPPRLLASLEPQFRAARHVLDDLKASHVGRWSGRIAVVPQSQPLLAPDMPAEVAEVVCEALLNERRFEISYRAIDGAKPKRYPLNPLGLVLHGGALYLVATARDYPDPCVYALHRMSNPRALDELAAVPPGFDLQRYIREEHAFEHPQGGELRLELHVSPWLARLLGERRLAADQTLTPVPGDERQRLRATVADTAQLRWWLRSFGSDVEVLKPIRLRREMAAEFTTLARTYRTVSP